MIFYTHPSYRIIIGLYHKFVGKSKKNIVIDSGCGNGYLVDLIGCKNIRYYLGYDVNKNAILFAKKRFKRCKNVNFSLTKVNDNFPKIRNNFSDAIFSIGVLQYLNNTEISDFFRTSKAKLNHKGKIFISCTTDHTFYKWFTLYNFFLPSHVNNRKSLLAIADNAGLKCIFQKESGLFLGPLFSHNLVLIFDILDKLLLRTKGKLGFFGKLSRVISTYIIQFESYLPIDYGYTLYLVLEKKQ